MARKEQLDVGMNLDAKDFEQNLQKVQIEIESFSTEGASSATKITTALENIQRGFDGVESKIERGRVVTSKDVGAMTQQFAILEGQIEQTFGSIEKAPESVRAAFAKAEKQLADTTTKVGQLDDAIKDNAGNLKAAGGNWTGFGASLEAVGGKIGTLAAKFGLFTAALSEGWQMGQKFNQFAKTDMSEWEIVVGRLGQKAHLVLSSVSDAVIEQWDVVRAVMTAGTDWADGAMDLVQQLLKGNIAGVKSVIAEMMEDAKTNRAAIDREVNEAAKTWVEAGGTVAKALSTYGTDWDKYAASVGLASGNVEKAATTTSSAAATTTSSAATTVAAADSTKQSVDAIGGATAKAETEVTKWRDAAGKLHVVIKQVAESADASAGSIGKISGAASAVEKAFGDVTKQVEAINSLVTAVEKLNEALRATPVLAGAAMTALEKMSSAGMDDEEAA